MPTRLGEVVRALSTASPWAEEGEELLEVCLHARELLRVAPGSRVLLRVRSEDLEWLNLQRPLFADRELRAVLWVDKPTLGALVRGAIDLFDWVSRVVPVPDRALPEFAVENVRRALALGDAFCWTGDGLLEVLRAAGCEEWVEIDAGTPAWELLDLLASPGLAIVSGLGSERDAVRIRMVRALAQREGAWVARDPGAPLGGMWQFHARVADWDTAAQRLGEAGWARPGLLAAWLDLEPEAIAWLADNPGAGPNACEQVHRSTGRAELHLVRALRELGAGPPPRELIDELDEAGFGDMAEILRLRLRGVSEQILGALRGRSHSARALEFANHVLSRAMEHGDARWQAEVRAQLGELHAERREYAQALEQLQRCLEIYEGLAEHERDLADVLERLGELELELGERSRARRYLGRALGIRRAWLAKDPTSRDAQVGLAGALADQGELHIASGDYALARECFENALERLDMAGDIAGRLFVHDRLAGLLAREGELERARCEFEAVVTGLDAWTDERPDEQHWRVQSLGRALRRLAWVCVDLDQLDAAVAYLQRGESIVRSRIERDPDHHDLRLDLVSLLRELARAHRLRGDVSGAQRRLDDALMLARSMTARYPEDLGVAWAEADCLEQLGSLHRSLGEHEAAVTQFEQSVAILQVLAERQPQRIDLQHDRARALAQLGELYRALVRNDDAQRQFEAALAILRDLEQRAPLDARITHELAFVLAALGHLGDRDDLRDQALERLEALESRGVLRASDRDLYAALLADAARRGDS